METSAERTQRTYIKLLLGIGGGFMLFVFLCWGGCQLYGVVESRHLSRRAVAYFRGGDLKQAALSARRALQLDQRSVEGVRVLADVAEAAGDRSALDWRRKASELAPNSTEDTLALANCATQFGEIAIAEKALSRVNDPGRRGTAEFHVAMGRLAEAKKDLAEAEGHWAKATELAPEDKGYQLQLGLVLLRLDDRAKRDRGRSILQALRHDEKQRGAATRALIVDGAAQRMDGESMAALARELQSYPEATFNDRLVYLDILRQLRAPEFTDLLTKIEQEAVSKPVDLATLLTWMKTSGMSLLAIDFARSLPDEVTSRWPVPMTLAEAHVKIADWAALEAWVKTKNWREFDFLRHAYLALALRQQDKPAAAEREWSIAEKDANTQGQHLSILARTISDWGWQKESVALLWSLTKQPDKQLEALQTLYQRYADAQDTLGLYRVLGKLVELRPDDSRIQNNFAQVCLLLNTDVEKAGKIAAALYEKEGKKPAYAATHAFALYTKGNFQGALQIMNALSDAELRDPSIAAYYGIILTGAGESAKAKEFLAAGATTKLLPEEKALVAKADAAK